MEIHHHGFPAHLEDDWWETAGMRNFVPSSRAYKTDDSEAIEIPIEDIGPLPERRRQIGIIRDDKDGNINARERVLNILRAFRLGEPLPPVVIKNPSAESAFPVDLANGTHRLYLSIAAGFTHIATRRYD